MTEREDKYFTWAVCGWALAVLFALEVMSHGSCAPVRSFLGPVG